MEVDFNANLTDTERAGVLSELKVISSTKKGTIPFVRDLGLDNDIPEDNSPIRKNEYASDLIEQVAKWDDRISIREVNLTDHELKVVIENG